MFFALRGDRFDGHDFLRAVAEQGAAAVVVERGRVPAKWNGCAMIAVEDALAFQTEDLLIFLCVHGATECWPSASRV